MILHRLALKDFRGIAELEIELEHRLNVICGVNGVGKSTLLDAIAIQLSWIIARIRSAKGSGRPISEHDIKNGAQSSVTQLLLEHGGTSYTGTLVKTRTGRHTEERSNMIDFSQCAKLIRQDITEHEHSSIPVCIYYPTNRVVTDIPLRIRGSHEFSRLETYDNSLETAVTFRRFFAWYRSREDLENEQYKEVNQQRLNDDEPAGPVKDTQLETVREAICALSGFTGISVKRHPLRMEVTKDGERLRVDQLSDGEKCLFAMAGDLARRLSIANPSASNPLEGEGVVLIDEIDLHLHPQWQKKIVRNLLHTFPNVQFIISTHSPQVLREIDRKHIHLLYQEDRTIRSSPVSKGRSSHEILEEIMDMHL